VSVNELVVILSRPEKYPSMKKAFRIIFYGQIENGRIIDIGDDPCFDSIPSWGICYNTTKPCNPTQIHSCGSYAIHENVV